MRSARESVKIEADRLLVEMLRISAGKYTGQAQATPVELWQPHTDILISSIRENMIGCRAVTSCYERVNKMALRLLVSSLANYLSIRPIPE
jgi:hypothetical protein